MVGASPAGPVGERVGRKPILPTLIENPARIRVVDVLDEPITLAALLWGGLLGLGSAVLLVAMVVPELELSSLQFSDLALSGEALSSVALLIPAWLVLTWLFSKRTGELALISRRGSALMALEFLVLGLWYRVEPLAGAATEGAAGSSSSSPGLAEQLAGTPATVGLWVCLLAWLACRVLAAPRQPVELSG